MISKTKYFDSLKEYPKQKLSCKTEIFGNIHKLKSNSRSIAECGSVYIKEVARQITCMKIKFLKIWSLARADRSIETGD